MGVPKPLNLPFDPIERAAESWRVHFGPSSAMAAVTSIMRAHQILLRQLDTLLRPHDLTFARYEALVLLTFSRTGALPLSRIGERLMVHPTSVTNTVDRLERAGLVRRMRNPRDGRGVLAEITEKGRELVTRATADLMEADFCMTMYGESDLAEMFGMLRTIRVAAGDFEPPGDESGPDHRRR
ncbi:MarR family transcriptional regulator [Sphaerisporangium sp. NPDC051017]|uniref:MarR family winged helix-turn-helix transcriptional regulator n=1 Tax=Sphaerisporangium sp. NPDC051017 TaxID=3154636 RepID=UPI003421CE27